MSARPVAHETPPTPSLPLSVVQPSDPGSCASDPSAATWKTETPWSAAAATYNVAPSGETARASAPPSTRPVAQVEVPVSSLPVSVMHPAAAGFWVRIPVAGSRSRTLIPWASLEYAWRPSGESTTDFEPPRTRPLLQPAGAGDSDRHCTSLRRTRHRIAGEDVDP